MLARLDSPAELPCGAGAVDTMIATEPDLIRLGRARVRLRTSENWSCHNSSFRNEGAGALQDRLSFLSPPCRGLLLSFLAVADGGHVAGRDRFVDLVFLFLRVHNEPIRVNHVAAFHLFGDRLRRGAGRCRNRRERGPSAVRDGRLASRKPSELFTLLGQFVEAVVRLVRFLERILAPGSRLDARVLDGHADVDTALAFLGVDTQFALSVSRDHLVFTRNFGHDKYPNCPSLGVERDCSARATTIDGLRAIFPLTPGAPSPRTFAWARSPPGPG